MYERFFGIHFIQDDCFLYWSINNIFVQSFEKTTFFLMNRWFYFMYNFTEQITKILWINKINFYGLFTNDERNKQKPNAPSLSMTSNGLCPTSNGLAMTNNGVSLTSNGLTMTNNGLSMTSNGFFHDH